MKLSLSMRGWLNRSFEKMTNHSLEDGFGGVELYNVLEDSDYTKKNAELRKENANSTCRAFNENGLELCCLDTSLDLSAESSVSENAEKLEAYIEYAECFRIPFLSFRLDSEADETVCGVLKRMVKRAESAGVALLIKTFGAYANTDKLRRLLDMYADDNLAALWDVYHTCADARETPSQTVEHLGAYIRHVHVRDADAEGAYTAVGEGILPLDDMMRALSSVDYDGFLSLEWKPGWQDIIDYDVIFAHYVAYMSKFEKGENAKRLYLNHDGTGKYIWKKDELIDMTFSDVLDRLVEEFPDQTAVKYTTLDYTRTYEEFRNDVNDFARALVALGVRPRHKVAIWATNVAEWFIAFWSVTKIGAVFVSVNTAYKTHEIEYLLKQSDTHTLIMIESTRDSNYKQIIRELCPETAETQPGQPLHCKRLPFLRNIITIGFRLPGCLTFREAVAKKDEVTLGRVLKMAAEVQPTDVCNMQYTSGTTGFPKGVMLTHYSVINNGKCIGDRMGLSTADRMMIQVPMFHCFGMVLSMTAAFTHGVSIFPMPYFSAKASLDCINQEKITCFNGVPTMFIAMFSHPDYKNTDFSHMRTGIMAGAGCPPDLMRRAARPDEMNMTGIVSVYGQTESSPGSTMSAWTDPLDVRCDTVGYSFPHICCKIIDPETGEELHEGQNGEFCSKGYNTMKGYYKMPDATKKSVDADGWLHSGDIAMRDADGNYRITGRLKDMIIRGGENIYPKEIEEFIYTHPDVKDVQVVGVPDEKYGEEAAACIILKEGRTLTEPEMRAYITQNIARHKVPRYILFVDSFPMNAAGKILKYKMREDLVKLLTGSEK